MIKQIQKEVKIFWGSVPLTPLAARAFGARDCLLPPNKSNLATAL